MSTRKVRLVLLAALPLLAGWVVVAPPAQYWPELGNDAEAMGAALGAVLGAAVGRAGARATPLPRGYDVPPPAPEYDWMSGAPKEW